MSKIFIFLFGTIFIFLIYTSIYLGIKNNYKIDKIIYISKGSSVNDIANLITKNENYLNKKIYLLYLKIFNKYFDTLKYGEYKIHKDLNLIQVTNLISNPSNVYRFLTIIGGWEKYQFDELINEKFNIYFPIKYKNIIADTYKYQSHNTFDEIYKLMEKTKKYFLNKYKDNKLFEKYSINEILIIASLLEKEGKSDDDKRLISSVIFNRLQKNLKLEIDATTIFSLTKGEYKLNRKLTYNDLLIKDKFNTYYIKGLPPEPICFVSMKTIEIVLENYKSDYLFYFFNSDKQKHVFSKTYKEHIKFLKKYRSDK